MPRRTITQEELDAMKSSPRWTPVHEITLDHLISSGAWVVTHDPK